MENKIDVSVIIPMYNSEKYIVNAIDSVVTQEAHGLKVEIIVVDDGSTDHSSAIVKDLVSDQIKLITLAKNSGLSNARNSGVKAALGEWIQFLDSDDRVCNDLYRKFEMARKPGFNCYIFSFMREYQDYTLKQTITEVRDKRAFGHFGGSACNKFIKKDIFIEFKNNYFSEDICFSVDMMNQRELKISLIQDAYYLYNKKGDQSMTSNFKEKEFNNMFSYVYNEIEKSDDLTKMFILEIFVASLFDRSRPFLVSFRIASKTLLRLIKYFPKLYLDQNRKYIKNIKIEGQN